MNSPFDTISSIEFMWFGLTKIKQVNHSKNLQLYIKFVRPLTLICKIITLTYPVKVDNVKSGQDQSTVYTFFFLLIYMYSTWDLLKKT